jgi:transposase
MSSPLWLLAQGWSANKVAELLERDAHTIGTWLAALNRDGPAALAFEQTGGAPRPRPGRTGRAEGRGPGDAAGGRHRPSELELEGCAPVHQARCGIRICRSACTRYLHRLGFVYKRPKQRLLKADEAKQAAFVEDYAALLVEARASGAKIYFVDEAHFRADADLRGEWVLEGKPSLVDSTCPRWGEKARYYSAVCLETGEVEHMELAGTSSATTSAAFLRQLRAKHPGPLIVIWDNGPAHGGGAVQDYLATPDLALRALRLPAYSPDFNPDEAIWA